MGSGTIKTTISLFTLQTVNLANSRRRFRLRTTLLLWTICLELAMVKRLQVQKFVQKFVQKSKQKTNRNSNGNPNRNPNKTLVKWQVFCLQWGTPNSPLPPSNSRLPWLDQTMYILLIALAAL